MIEFLFGVLIGAVLAVSSVTVSETVRGWVDRLREWSKFRQ